MRSSTSTRAIRRDAVARLVALLAVDQNLTGKNQTPALFRANRPGRDRPEADPARSLTALSRDASWREVCSASSVMRSGGRCGPPARAAARRDRRKVCSARCASRRSCSAISRERSIPYTAGKRDFLLLRILARRLAERFRRLLHVENIVDNLKREADMLAEARQRVELLRIRARINRAHADAGAQQRSGLWRDEWIRADAPSETCLRLQDRSPARRSFRPPCRKRSPVRGPARCAAPASIVELRQHFKRQRQQRIARQNRHRVAENFVTRRTAAAQIVIIERGQIVVDQRIGMDQLERRKRPIRCPSGASETASAAAIASSGRMRLPPANRL